MKALKIFQNFRKNIREWNKVFWILWNALDTNTFLFLLSIFLDFIFLFFFFLVMMKRHVTSQSHDMSHNVTS